MSELMNSEKPCLVQTGRGFSVVYRNRFLYSKYDPAKNILSAVQSLHILPGTLILACSPCLGTGLAELEAKLPENCMILGCEPDAELYEFTKTHIPSPHGNFALLVPAELTSLPLLLNKRSARTADGTALPPPGTFRRVVRIDLSAGTQFAPDYFSELVLASEEAVGRFWKNRVTLVKLGRTFSRNLLRNLPRLCSTTQLASCVRTVIKPIVVFGAGESMEETARQIIPFRRSVYITAVDAALPSLQSLGIVPDAVVCEEAQAAIAPAFFGIQNEHISLFSGITSWPPLYTLCADKAQLRYFAPQYDDTVFFEQLTQSGILPPVIPPLGSVGLTAVYLSLLLRANGTVPIFVTGLDFSYTPGKTHARGTPAHTARLCLQSRTVPAENYDAAFGYGVSSVLGKNGGTVCTTPALLSYAQTFTGLFSGEKNLFDTGKTGITLGLPYHTIPDYTRAPAAQNTGTGQNSVPDAVLRQRIMQFYEAEENALQELTGILSNATIADEAERNVRIRELLAPREYLYLHFPDGLEPSLSPSFLKRVRAEIDFFRKDIRTGIQLLTGSSTPPAGAPDLRRPV